MKKSLLVIGGSYFLGRMFTLLADKAGAYDITVLNRGRFPFKTGNVRQIVCDRRDGAALSSVPFADGYDAIVDFCAELPGDCQTLFAALKNVSIGQYVHIGSCAV
ncbi:MAG TPA: hypothetical protein DEB31_10065, partial [Clostridiales bacterium]|nr:hypothetical protein [Clostridiales bacterium]